MLTQVDLIETLLSEQKKYINYFFSHLDRDQLNKIFYTCLECKGLLIFTGVGKSGIIAEKIAMTLISTGTRALFLPPINFLHGDIGILNSGDMVFLLSKSGETEELLNLVPFMRKKQAMIVSVVSNSHSRLVKDSDLSICLPVEKELCPFDLAPTTSTEVQLLFGDLLAAALMQTRGFSLDSYADNHPGGSIGKKMTLLVKDLMLRGENIPFCSPEAKLMEVLVELSNKKCGCLIIVDETKTLLGIFTDGDLRRSLQTQGVKAMEKKMKELMTLSPICVEQNVRVWDAIKIMQKDAKRWVMMAPVLDQEKVVGIIRMHDIIQAGV